MSEEFSEAALKGMSPELLRMLGMLDEDEPESADMETGNSSAYDAMLKREGELVGREVTSEWRPPAAAGLENSNALGSDSEDSNSDSDSDSNSDSDSDSDDFEVQVKKAAKNQEARADHDRKRKEAEIKMEKKLLEVKVEAALLIRVRGDAVKEAQPVEPPEEPEAKPAAAAAAEEPEAEEAPSAVLEETEEEPFGPQSAESFVMLPQPSRRMSKMEKKVNKKWEPPASGGAQRWFSMLSPIYCLIS